MTGPVTSLFVNMTVAPSFPPVGLALLVVWWSHMVISCNFL
jgi:hypothetical protein